MADGQTLGGRLKKLRKKNGLTQEKAALQLLVSRETIRNWESDFCEPPCSALTKLSALYHISVDEILGISDAKVIHLDKLSHDHIEVISILVKLIGEREQKISQE